MFPKRTKRLADIELMADNLSKEKRSELMSKVRHFGTQPELEVRCLLEELSVKFKEHDEGLPGRPDFVVLSHGLAIFVNGCFWHGHSCRKGRQPKSNKSFWSEKICRNKKRDRRVKRKLWKMGWHIVTVWECHLRNRQSVKRRLKRYLRDDFQKY